MPLGVRTAHLPELGCIGIVLLPLASCKAVNLALQALGTALLFLHGALHSLQLLLEGQAGLSGHGLSGPNSHARAMLILMTASGMAFTAVGCVISL